MFIPFLILLSSFTYLSAASYEYGIDGRWWHPTDSHHLQHAMGGVGVGFCTDAVLQFTDTVRWKRVATATGAALVVGIAIEYINKDDPFSARSDGAIIDPIDIAWATLGGLVGASVAELGGTFVRFSVARSGASAEIAWRF